MQDLHKECNSKGNQRIDDQHDFVDNVLYGYVCALCSYVQLNKKHVITHLENEHQQLITEEENIVEIVLLKITQPTTADIPTDNKNEKTLVDAKQRISVIHQPNRYQNFSPVLIPDEDDEDEGVAHETTIDLTLSDDED